MLYIILIFFINSSFSYEDKDREINKNIKSILHFHFGAVLNNRNSEFFEIYRKDLGGNIDDFKISPTAGLTIKYGYKDVMRLGVSVSYYSFRLYDEMEQEINSSVQARREIVEDFDWTDIPILFIAEYNPKKSHQFKSYAGAGIGVVVSKVFWNEEIQTYDWDIRQGGIVYDEFQFYPTFRLYFGTELGFDKEKKESLLGGITFEPRINYILRKDDLFYPIQSQIENQFHGLGKSFWFNNFIFELNIGLTLNFYHKKKGVK